MLTINGYQIAKTSNDPAIKKALMVKPFSLFSFETIVSAG